MDKLVADLIWWFLDKYSRGYTWEKLIWTNWFALEKNESRDWNVDECLSEILKMLWSSTGKMPRIWNVPYWVRKILA